MPPVRVTVAVPTYRRPDQLQELLPMVLDQARAVTASAPADWRVDVLVVDNDPGRSAAPAVLPLAGHDLRYVPEPRPGIPVVRNRALDEAAASDVVVFIDDDERPRPGWLAALLDTWRETGAAVVCGRVVVEPTTELDPWIEAGGFFARPQRPTGTPLAAASTCNLLVDRVQVAGFGVRFAEELGMGGGEDTLFTRSVHRAGGAMVWCNESVVTDVVPASRTTRSWVLRRSWSHGNVQVLTGLRLATGARARSTLRLRALAGGVGRVGGGAARWLVGALGRSLSHRARGLRLVLRGAGMVAASVGVTVEEYARPQGQSTAG